MPESAGKTKRMLIAAGGTGGHIFPALAAWEVISERHPDVRLTWIGTSHRMESHLVPARGIDFIGLRQTEIRRRPTPGNVLYNIRSLWFLTRSIFQLIGYVRKLEPRLILTTGGFAAGAAGLAAGITGTPLAIIEPNAYPGLTNRYVGKRANAVFIAYNESRAFFPEGKTHMVGVPARREVVEKNRDDARRELSLNDNTLMILLMGGSQGATAINRVFPEAMKLVVEDYQDGRFRVIHQCGQGKLPSVQVDREVLSLEQYKLMEFIEDVPTYLAAADIVISRAGASTLSEIACSGLPAIIIPYAHSSENHQVKNAQSWEQAGAAFFLEERDLTPSSLAGSILALLTDADKRTEMGAAARRFGDPSAAEHIADILERYLTD